MDDPYRGRRQNEAPMHPSSNPRYAQSGQDPSQAPRRPYGVGHSGDRYRPAPLSTSSAATARAVGGGGSAAYSGYYPEPSASAFSTTGTLPQAAPMGYHQPAADYGQDARQTQGFVSPYNPAGIMYNVQQPSPHNPAYDTNQQFPSRQPAAMQMMSTDVASPYFQGEPSSAAASSLQSQGAAPNAGSSVYQQSSADRSAMLHGYSPGMASMGPGGVPAQASSSSAAEAAAMEEQEYAAAAALDDAYTGFQNAIREVFQNIRAGTLVAASESLLSVSDWLLSHVVDLGLTSDDPNLQEGRVGLWNDFNHAWLALFQRQKNTMSGRGGQRSQDVLSQEQLENMGDELVRFCDGLERHGLVDYQYGVWEERIVTIIQECLELCEGEGEEAAGPSSSQGQ